MSYSCSDFTDDILNKFCALGLIHEGDVNEDDPEQQANCVMGAIDTLLERNERLRDLLRAASAPGGIGEHEFSRAGGWRDQALMALEPDGAALALYFIAAVGGNGENLDLCVRASSVEDATSAWREYYKDADLPEQPDWVGIVPTARPHGAIAWEDIRRRGSQAEAHPQD